MFVATYPDTRDLAILTQVDGLGNALTDYEDPNVPSLLSIPLLGYPMYSHTIYANTRARILSHENKFFVEGAVWCILICELRTCVRSRHLDRIGFCIIATQPRCPQAKSRELCKPPWPSFMTMISRSAGA